MDLSLFRPNPRPGVNYKRFDRLNSCTGKISCRLLELIGWYTSNVRLRLLGHYRLYQLYKQRRSNGPQALPLIQGYILQYRASFWIKHYSYILISRIPTLFGDPGDNVEMQALNNVLIHQGAYVLYEFLEAADRDFEEALIRAVRQINDPDFINTAQTRNSSLFLNLQQHNSYTDAHNELNIHPTVEKQTVIEKETIIERESTLKEIIIKEPAGKEPNGKERGVFSKKQILIILDLLSKDGKIDRLSLDNPTKAEPFARFLVALTGKSLDTWLKALRDYRGKDLYTYSTPAERKSLLDNLDNISTITRNGGFRSIADLVDKKIKLIERRT